MGQRNVAAPQLFKAKEFNFEKLGIGGLDDQFEQIFRRAFASRVFPPSVVERLGIRHVKGVLLFGPPGTGDYLVYIVIRTPIVASMGCLVEKENFIDRETVSASAVTGWGLLGVQERR